VIVGRCGDVFTSPQLSPVNEFIISWNWKFSYQNLAKNLWLLIVHDTLECFIAHLKVPVAIGNSTSLFSSAALFAARVAPAIGRPANVSYIILWLLRHRWTSVAGNGHKKV
jgi:hypothetical protein